MNEMDEEKSIRRVFIGAAWPYANGPLHLGTLAGCLLPADIYGRYQRMAGREVLMVSGSDEHGTPITLTADREGVPPAEIANRYNAQHVQNIRQLGIQFENYTRTSGEFHKKVVQDFFLRLMDNGYIYRKSMLAPYCRSCRRFLPDRYVEGVCPHCGGEARGDQCDNCGKTLEAAELREPRCKICGAPPEMQETEHFFFRLSAFEERLLEWLEDKDFWRDNVIKFSRNWIRQGLQDRAITRDLEWGVPIPLEGYEHKRLYVWFEAVIGYLSASKEWAEKQGQPEAWRRWWQEPVRHLYFLAKDNIPFHTIIWPAMLMGHGDLNLPSNVPANEYLTFSGKQFSKSRGIGVWLPDVLEHLDPDAVRYYLSINMPERHDTDWNWEDFVAKNNNELVGNFGNFIHRVVTFTQKNFGRVPPAGEMTEADRGLLTVMQGTVAEVGRAIEQCTFKEGMKAVIRLSQAGNQYLNDQAPWKLVTEDRERCATVLHLCLRMVRTLAVVAAPYMPHAGQRIWEMLGQEGRVEEQPWDGALDDVDSVALQRPSPLFEKLELAELVGPEREEEPTEGEVPAGRSPAALDLRIATVARVREHPDADKLYVLDLDVGEVGRRRIVAGIRPWYERGEVEGAKIVLVANMKPATIRGVRSQGMLLAADDGSPALLVPGGEAGEAVSFEGVAPQPVDSVDLGDFEEMGLAVDGQGRAHWEGRVLVDSRGPVGPDRRVAAGTPIH
ncbi:MAG: methionine--tRNA ligase [Candidatus Thermoplasmatota archaeon]|nr:methionine--tRNA ligase [Candidatus Thermoplasmatota archaeon]